MYEYDTIWDRDFYDVVAEADHADRWQEAWDRLEALGVVSHPEDSDVTLSELERIAGYVKS